MATTASGKLSARDFATLEALVTFSRNLVGTASGLLGDLGEQIEMFAIELEGIPVAVRDIEHSKRYQVTAVSNAVLPDARFYGHGKFQKRAIPALFH